MVFRSALPSHPNSQTNPQHSFPTTHLQTMLSIPLCTMALVPLLLAVTLMPLPTSARPIASFTLAARQNASASIKHYAIFDIAFFLGVPTTS